MTCSRPRLTSYVLIALLATTAGVSAQQEQEISCSAVPAAVRSAFEKAYPKATVKGCAKEIEKGNTAYEISSSEGVMGRDVLFHPDGSLIVVEETITMRDLPDMVQQAVQRKFPRGQVTLVEKVMRDADVQYEFRVKHQGKLVEIVFDPHGNEIKP